MLFFKCDNLTYIICNDKNIDALKGILPEELHEKIVKKSCYDKAKEIIGKFVKNTNVLGEISESTGLPNELVDIIMQQSGYLDAALEVNIPRNDVAAEWQEYEQKIAEAFGIKPNLKFLPASQLNTGSCMAHSSSHHNSAENGAEEKKHEGNTGSGYEKS